MLKAVRRGATMLVLLGALAGCTAVAENSFAEQSRPPSPFAACPAADAPAPPDAVPDSLPAVTLPCFTGDTPVALNRLGRPAVINFWASWCTPCRRELPALQAFADEAGDQVVVLGVASGDTWTAAASAGDSFGARYANVFDPDYQLLHALGRNNLPATIFLAADGSVRGTDASGALTADRLRELAVQYLGYAP